MSPNIHDSDEQLTQAYKKTIKVIDIYSKFTFSFLGFSFLLWLRIIYNGVCMLAKESGSIVQ